jgi:hypothetical protein
VTCPRRSREGRLVNKRVDPREISGDNRDHNPRPVLTGNVCTGSWEVIGEPRFFRNHFGWLFTAGLVSGWFYETETDELSGDGNSYTDTNGLKMYDLSGNYDATASAARIEP